MRRAPSGAVRGLDEVVPEPPGQREVLSALPARDTRRPPLLFVHGMGHGAWCFAEHWLGAAAAHGYPAYALSLRGHGAGGGKFRPRRPLMRDYLYDVLQTAAALPSPPVLIGHAMGGALVQLALERYPAPAGVLLGPMPIHGGLGMLATIARDRPAAAARALTGRTLPMTGDALFNGLDPDEAERFAEQCGPESSLVQFDLMLRRRSRRPITAPLLVIGTPDDKCVRFADVRRTAREHNVVPVWFPGMGHDLMLDRGQDRVLETILEWLGRAVPDRPLDS